MPREAEASAEFLENKLKDWEVFHKDGNLKGKRDPIWNEIKKSLDLKMTVDSLYLYVYADRHNVRTNLERYRNVIKNKKRKMNKMDTDLDYYDDETHNNPHNCDILDFKIAAEIDQIVDLAARKKQPFWYEVVKDKISKSQNLPCVYNFKNSYLTKESLKFNGFCRECKTSIRGESHLHNDQTYTFLTIHIRTFCTRKIPHSSKRKLTGPRREKIGNELLTKTPTEYREEQIDKLTTSFEPPDLNRTDTLQKLREEALNKASGYAELKGLSITNKKFIEKCSIRKLSLYPLYVCYWTEAQLTFWNKLQHKCLPLSLDSTGGLTKKYLSCSGKILFYYVIVMGYKNKIIPLLQVVSSIHHVLFIKEFLEKWLESGAKIPREMATDGSLALQNGICIAFNKMTYKMYNNHCFKILTNLEKTLPNCYYRHDVAHLINAVRKWKSFDKSNVATIDFFVRSIGYLTQVENLQEFEEIVISIVIICNSTLSEEESECYRRKVTMTNIFKTFEYRLDSFISVDNLEDICDNEYVNFPEEEIDQAKDSITKYIDTIFEKGINLSNVSEELSDKANYLYCPQFIKNFKNLCYSFVTWTNVMKAHFKSPNNVGSSARSEAYFKKIKQNTRPKQLQKYILDDVNKVNKYVSVGNLLLKKDKNNDNDIFVDNSPKFNLPKLKMKSHCDESVATFDKIDEQSVLDEADSSVDNTYAKPMPIKNKSRAVENIEEPEDNSTHNDLSFYNDQILASSFKDQNNVKERGLVFNGNKMGQNIYCMNGTLKSLRFQNTCPFDSVFEIMTTIYLENEKFKLDVINQCYNSSSIFHCIVDYCNNDFNTDYVYNHRCDILYPLYENAKHSTEFIIDCNDNVGNLFERLMKPLPSILKTYSCSLCGYEKQIPLYNKSVSATDYYDRGINNIELFLDNELLNKNTFCTECANKSLEIKHQLSNYFVIDVEYLHEEKNADMILKNISNKVTLKTDFEQIPKIIELKNQNFELKGVISFEGDSKNPNALAHYKSYVCSTNEKWIMFNDLASDLTVLYVPPIKKIALIIYAKVDDGSYINSVV